MPDQDFLPPGHVLGERYEIGEVIGQGAFGVVYRAQDRELDRTVAIKEFLPWDVVERGADGVNIQVRTARGVNCLEVYEKGLASFRREAKILAKVNHPNVVQGYDVLEVNGTAYLVMEYCVGKTLEKVIEEEINDHRDPDPARVQCVLKGLQEGLRNVHAEGLLHRDVKPANICLVNEGQENERPVLLDFGAARRVVVEGTHSTTIHRVFTPCYAAMEQYIGGGKEEGPWTDVYGLGATLYYWITHNRPTEATERVGNDFLKPLIKVNPKGYPSYWLASVDWALKVRKEKRPQSVEGWQAVSEGRRKPPRIKTRGWIKQAVLAVGVIGLVAGGGWGYQQYQEAETARQQAVAEVARQQAVAEVARQQAVAEVARQQAAAEVARQQAAAEVARRRQYEIEMKEPEKVVELIPAQDVAVSIAYWSKGQDHQLFDCVPLANKPGFEIFGAELSGEIDSRYVVGYERGDIRMHQPSLPVYGIKGCHPKGYCDSFEEFCRHKSRAKGCYVNKEWYDWYKRRNADQGSIYKINYDTICSS